MKNYFDLTGKTALITGASKGLGARFAQILSEYGCSIIAAARNESNLAKLCAKIESAGGNIKPLVMDVSNPQAINDSIGSIEANGEKIDILINNASGIPLTPITGPHLQEWEQHLNTNLLGPWHHAVKALVQSS